MDWKETLAELLKDKFVSRIETGNPEQRKLEYDELDLDPDLFKPGWRVVRYFKGFPRKPGKGEEPKVLVETEERHGYELSLSSGAHPTEEEAATRLLAMVSKTEGWERYAIV